MGISLCGVYSSQTSISSLDSQRIKTKQIIMCLRTKQICPLRARRDIVCYKIFRQGNRHDFIYTLYVHQYVLKPTEGNPTLMDDTNKPLSILPVRNSLHGRAANRQIWGGMIHAFRTEAVARDYLIYSINRRVYKCIIPKGTLYYVGIQDDICAKRMLIVEEVNPNTAG